MEYKYEIVVDHPLEIPHQLKLDADFADVIGKSLQVGLQMGYADEPIGTIDLEPPPKTDQQDVNDYHIIKVAYPKRLAESEITGGTTVVLNAQLAGAFLESIEPGTRLTPEAFADTGGRWVSARMQLKSKMDVDPKTANLMGRYFTAVEKKDWVAFRNCISDHIQYIGGPWLRNDGDLGHPASSSNGHPRGIGAYQLVATSQKWREQYNHVHYVLDMSRCVMNETTAIVTFKILSSEDGVDYNTGLAAVGTCTSIYQIEDNKIASLQHMVPLENSASNTEKLSEFSDIWFEAQSHGVD